MPLSKKTIAVIGAGGPMGTAIAKALASGHYRLLLFDETPEKLRSLVDDIRHINPEAELEPMDCAHSCSWEADIIILAVPHGATKEIARKIRKVATQKIVISIANPFDENAINPAQFPDTSAAEELQQWLPHSKVVKAFNTTFAADFAQPIIAVEQADAFVAGNEPEALQTVSELVKTAGFHPVLVDDLVFSRTLERMQQLLIQLKIVNSYTGATGWKILRN